MYASKLKMFNNKLDSGSICPKKKDLSSFELRERKSESVKNSDFSNDTSDLSPMNSNEEIKKSNNNRPDNLDSKRKGLYQNKPECLIVRDITNLMKKLKTYREDPDNTMKDQISSTILDLEAIINNLIQNFNNNVWSIGDDLMEETTSPKLCHKYPNCSNCIACWFVHLRKDEVL